MVRFFYLTSPRDEKQKTCVLLSTTNGELERYIIGMRLALRFNLRVNMFKINNWRSEFPTVFARSSFFGFEE